MGFLSSNLRSPVGRTIAQVTILSACRVSQSWRNVTAQINDYNYIRMNIISVHVASPPPPQHFHSNVRLLCSCLCDRQLNQSLAECSTLPGPCCLGTEARHRLLMSDCRVAFVYVFFLLPTLSNQSAGGCVFTFDNSHGT